MKQLKGCIAVIVLLAILSIAEGLLYVQVQDSYSSLQSKYSSLDNSYNALRGKHSSLIVEYDELMDYHHALQDSYRVLEQNYSSLIEDYYLLQDYYWFLEQNYSDLQSDYEFLEQEYNALVENHYALQNDYRLLKQEHSNLAEDYSLAKEHRRIETILRIGNSLASYYDIVRRESGSFQSDAEEAQFMAKLALHSLGRNCWPLLESKFYQNVGNHSYKVARALLEAVISLTGANTSQTSVEVVRNILYFINQHIHYEYDTDDISLAPAETLGYKSGDCDDFTILAASLFEALGIESAVGLFEYQKPGAEKQYHCMVLVRLDNLGEYTYWYYQDLTSMGLRAGKWIIIEPQYAIERQGSEWVGKWELIAAAPVD